jgi:hypothetical protein
VDVALRPFFRRKYLLSIAERRFHKVLCEVVFPNPVLAKVRLVDLVDADKRHPLWLRNFRRICSKQIDFVVCDAALSPVIAIELDDSSHQRPGRRARDKDVDRIFALAAFPILHVPVQKKYSAAEIEQHLLAKLGR